MKSIYPGFSSDSILTTSNFETLEAGEPWLHHSINSLNFVSGPKAKIWTEQWENLKEAMSNGQASTENCKIFLLERVFPAMVGMGKSLLLYNKVDGLDETFKKVNNISAEELQEIANEVFMKNQLSSLIFKPKNI